MANWRELAATAIAGRAADDQPQAPPPLVGPFAAEVARLKTLPPPRRLSKPAIWPEIVADTERLVRSGWAERALALGWSDHDLFGIGRTSSDEFEGLAVWLAGRTVAALTEWQARTSCDGIFYRESFMRPNSPKVDPVFLWQFGRPS